MNPVLCLKQTKKKGQRRKKSKRIGESVLPIYTATSKSIIKSNICNKYYKIQFICNIANKYNASARRLRDDGAFHAPRSRVPCAAQLCAATLLYRVSAAVPKLIISKDFAKPWKKLLHNVMQYSAEGSKLNISSECNKGRHGEINLI